MMGSYPETPWLVRKAYRVIQRSLETLAPASPTAAVDVAALRRHFMRLPFKPFAADIPGWLSSDEQKALYYLGRMAAGPVMEIGAFCGRSTVCIARGIADSGRPRRFLSCEMNPKAENFRPLDETSVGFIYPPGSDQVMDTISREHFEQLYQRYISLPGGIIGQARANIARYGVADLVDLREGDFREQPEEKFSFIFSDTMHDEAEVLRNLPAIRRYMDRRCTLACHDTTPENERILRQHLPIGESFQVHALFIAEIES